jgi:DNA-binding MurR/RpiR family transcriptional regulator
MMDVMFQALLQRIAQAYPSLSKQGEQLAQFFQQDPLSAAQLSLTEIAQQTGISKSTISRFFRQIGYQSHQDMRQQLLQARAKGYPVFQSADLHELVKKEQAQIHHAIDQFDLEQIEKVVQRLEKAARIILIGYRNSYPIALHMREQLLQIRGGVDVLPLPGQTLSEELAQLPQDNLIFVIGFRRRPRLLVDVLKALPEEQTILLSDPSGGNLSQYVGMTLYADMGSEAGLDSYSAPFSLVSLICNRLMHYVGSSSKQRISSISTLYQDLQEL